MGLGRAAEAGVSAASAGPDSRLRAEAKRERILEVATRHFAERGYGSTRVEDIAAELAIAKGSVFQHFKTKAGLFLATYKKAALSMHPFLDVPGEVLRQGFFAIIRYWLVRTVHLSLEEWVRFRVTLLGDYGTDLPLKREINRFMVARDPYGIGEFVRKGVEWGEVRPDLDPEMIMAFVDWTTGRVQETMVKGEFEAGSRPSDAGGARGTLERIDQLMKIIRGAIGRPGSVQDPKRATDEASYRSGKGEDR